ncbi:nitrogen regulation protein NR(II) [candidate division KSB1 bacterium]
MAEKEENLDFKELNKAFDIFNQVSSNLVEAYSNLENKVSQLDMELEKKNRKLSDTLLEIDSIKNHLNNILESMNTGVIVVNIQGRITIFNSAAQELTGYDGKEVLRKTYKHFFIRKESGKSKTPLDALQDKKIYRNVEKNIMLKSGDMIPVQSNIAPVVDKEGSIIGAVETFIDLRAVNKLKEEVEKSKTLAALGEMSANVAHEIRNPLAGIGGYAALLERDLEDKDPRRQLVKKIIEGVSSLNKIATNLLFYTRPMRPSLRIENISYILEEVLNWVQMEVEQEKREIQIVRDFSRTDYLACIDPEIFMQVFLNIFKNAVQSIDSSGKVEVKVKDIKETNRIAIEISDTGIGMDEEIKGKIFNPFFTTRSDGTGLGMAIVKKIIDSHGGEITLESEVGKGTRFLIKIPKTSEA